MFLLWFSLGSLPSHISKFKLVFKCYLFSLCLFSSSFLLCFAPFFFLFRPLSLTSSLTLTSSLSLSVTLAVSLSRALYPSLSPQSRVPYLFLLFVHSFCPRFSAIAIHFIPIGTKQFVKVDYSIKLSMRTFAKLMEVDKRKPTTTQRKKRRNNK